MSARVPRVSHPDPAEAAPTWIVVRRAHYALSVVHVAAVPDVNVRSSIVKVGEALIPNPVNPFEMRIFDLAYAPRGLVTGHPV